MRFSKIFESLLCFWFGEIWYVIWNLNVLGKILDEEKLLMQLGECEKGEN